MKIEKFESISWKEYRGSTIFKDDPSLDGDGVKQFAIENIPDFMEYLNDIHDLGYVDIYIKRYINVQSRLHGKFIFNLEIRYGNKTNDDRETIDFYENQFNYLRELMDEIDSFIKRIGEVGWGLYGYDFHNGRSSEVGFLPSIIIQIAKIKKKREAH